MNQQLTIEASFPGGNIILERIEGDSIYLQQELRDTRGHWFYWAFQIDGAHGRQLTFHFTDGDVLGARGPAISIDDGHTWEWLGEEAVTREDNASSFTYRFAANSSKLLFAFCPIYTQTNFDEFLSGTTPSRITKTNLCQSSKSREVELLRLGNSQSKTRVAFTCRHHACEAMASFCLEGILETILADDEAGEWLRQNIDFAVVPFMDKDGVEAGDQGKNRRPFDHNRDYGGNAADSIYSEVKAWRQWSYTWLRSAKTAVLLDLHCPAISGGANEEIFFAGPPSDAIWNRVLSLCSILEENQTGAIPFSAANSIPFGKGWNSYAALGYGCNCSMWAAQIPSVSLAAILEVAYANAGGAPVTPQSCRALGRDLMLALRALL